jgi:integrase
MPSVVVEALLSHRRAQNEERHRVGDLWRETGLVFATGTGRALDPRNLSTTYHRLLSHVDVPHIRFHDLRHTCATLLLGRGVSPRVVMDILGHSQIAVTMNIYGHVMPAMKQQAAGQIDAALGGLSVEPRGDQVEPA